MTARARGASVILDRVSRRFGQAVAVDDVTLDLPAGRYITLLGPSGCGKTTLLRMIAGLEAVGSGRVLIGDRDVTDLPPRQRDTSIMFQDYALFPHLTVRENIGFGLRMRKAPTTTIRQRVDDMLAFVDLAGAADRLPNQLSGGQRQRVALARSLVIEPAVLLLDEPLGALDAHLRRRLQTELRAVQQRVGTTFIHVTHDQEEAMCLSDLVVVMNRGRVVQADEPRTLYLRPRDPFVASFVGGCNLIEATVIEAGEERLRLHHPALGAFVAVNPHAAPAAPGRQIRLAVRPEHLVLGTAAEEQPNRAVARLGASVFVGAVQRCALDLPGLSLTAELPGQASALSGTQVVVGFPAEAAIALHPS
jgi:spermidine/putrescine transport system ATP-binding protein